MRYYNILYVVLIASFLIYKPTDSIAQDSDSLKIEDLAIPVSPGFQILGISPQEISRPTTVTALNAFFINSVTSPGGLTEDMAVEFSPYWLSDKANLSFDCFYELDNCSDSRGERIYRSLVFSIASTNYETMGDSLAGRNWGIGGKFTLIRAKATKKMEDLIFRLNNGDLNVQATYSTLTDGGNYGDGELNQTQVIETIRNEINNSISAANSEAEKASLEKLYEKLVKEVEKEKIDSKSKAIEFFKKKESESTVSIASTLKSIKVEDSDQKVGLNVDVAFGTVFTLPENQIEDAFFDRYGVWLTSTYTSKKNPSLSAALLVRRLLTYQDYGSTNTDIGFSFAYQKRQFSTNLEGIFRNTREEFLTTDLNGATIPTFNKEDTFRFTWNSVLKVTDDFKLNLSLGKDFDSEIRVTENFIGLLGISLDLFKDQFMYSGK